MTKENMRAGRVEVFDEKGGVEIYEGIHVYQHNGVAVVQEDLTHFVEIMPRLSDRVIVHKEVPTED
jgi:hypothetical protein